jgi:serine/threonine-protein kinase
MDPYHTSSTNRPRTHGSHRHGLSARHVVGGWELVDCLGQGEWSTVYSGRPRDCPPDWPADYAIKIARLDAQRRQQARQLLVCEAAASRAVVHPHLVSVLAAELELTPPLLVMPLLQGTTLERALAAHAPFSTPHALWITRQVAEALQALHDAGWVHADVKPGNIHVSVEGHATLIDLGFAMQLQSADCGVGGSLRGSPMYTAPEMISSAVPVDGQCDVYSLGATLYELLTGTPPFAERDPGRLMLAHLQQPVPHPRRAIPSLHRGVAALLRGMLAKEPLRRPPPSDLIRQLVDLEIATLEERVA